MATRKCRWCNEVFEADTEGKAQAKLLSHLKTCEAKPQDEGVPPEGEELAPLVQKLRDTLLRLEPKSKNLIASLVETANQNPEPIFSSPANLHSYLSDYGFSQATIKAAINSIFGYQPPSLGLFSQRQAPWAQPWQGAPYVPYQPSPLGSREVYQFGWYPVYLQPGPAQAAPQPPVRASEERPTESDVVTRSEFTRELSQMESRLASLIQDLVQRPRQVEEQRREGEEQLRLSTEVARLSERLTSNEQIQQLRDELNQLRLERQSRGSGETDERLRNIEARLQELQKGAIEQQLAHISERLSFLEAEHKARTPSEAEIKSQNLLAVLERVGEDFNTVTEKLEKFGSALTANALYSSMIQSGLSPGEAAEVARDVIRAAQGSPSTRPLSREGGPPGSSLRERAREFERRYIKPEAWTYTSQGESQSTT